MAEGGIYPWKLQKIKEPKNGRQCTCQYSDLSKPLPNPPKGQMWVQDESTREWKLAPVATATSDTVAVARVAKATDVADATTVASGSVCEAIPVAVEPEIINGIRYHEVLPTDTFQGICLRYKVTPTELRRANRMMGSNLKLAPNPEKLIIPFNDKNHKQLNDNVSQTKEEKIACLLSKVSRITRKDKLTYSEARAYLEMADWDVNRAVENVNEDFGWTS